jgi:predicted PurR-regulated permease PerM
MDLDGRQSRSPRRVVSLTPRTIVVALGLAIAALLVLGFAWETRRVLVWILIATFLALALDHLVRVLERRMSRGMASIVAFVILLLVFGGIGYLLVPPLVAQVQDFVEAVPGILEELSKGRGPLGFLEREFSIVERARAFVEEEGAGGSLGLSGPVVSVVTSIVTGVVGAVAVAFLTLFMLMQGPALWVTALDAVPERQRPLWERIGEGLHRAIGGWIMGVGLVAFLAGTAASLVLFGLGVPYAIALGVIVAVLDPIPFVGATVAAVIVSAVAWATEGAVPALIFFGFVIVYQNVIENHILVPLVYGRTVALNALTVLVAVLLGGELAGVIGAILAIPVAAMLKVVGSELLAWRRASRIELPPETEPAEVIVPVRAQRD